MRKLTCAQFHDLVDSYIDAELTPAAAFVADRHLAECLSCTQLAASVRAVKSMVRDTVRATTAPPMLESRIRSAISTRWRAPRRWASAAAVMILIAGAGSFRHDLGDAVANVMERVALRAQDSTEMELHGTLLCRDCELAKRYGFSAPCPVIGHHGAIVTPDGRIWNLIEQTSTSELIHDNALLGRQIVVRGRFFRSARALIVSSYTFSS